MQGRLFVSWRDDHQAHYRQVHLATFRDERIGVRRGDAGLLRLFPRIYLHKQRWTDAPGLDRVGKLSRQFWAIYRLDGVEQIQRLINLVGLQWADQVNLHVVIFFPKIWPARRGLLHTIFPKQSLSLIEYRRNPVKRLHL